MEPLTCQETHGLPTEVWPIQNSALGFTVSEPISCPSGVLLQNATDRHDPVHPESPSSGVMCGTTRMPLLFEASGREPRAMIQGKFMHWLSLDLLLKERGCVSFSKN